MRVESKALMRLPAPDTVRTDARKMVEGLRKESVKDAILGDVILMKLASKLFQRHGREKPEITRAPLREMGRLLVEVRKSSLE